MVFLIASFLKHLLEQLSQVPNLSDLVHLEQYTAMETALMLVKSNCFLYIYLLDQEQRLDLELNKGQVFLEGSGREDSSP